MKSSDTTLETSQENPLGYEKESKLLVGFAIPCIISMLVTALYNIVDQIFIGQGVGMLGNAATNIAFPLSTTCTAISLLLGIGSATNFSLHLGAGEKDESAKYAGNGMCLMAVFGISLFLLTTIFLTPMLKFFGATTDVLPYAEAYTRITAIGFPFLIANTGMSKLILADGSPRYSMISMLDMALEREDDRILYLMQDMREFEPGEKVSAVVSACDSINYILEPEDLQAVFFCVSESLKEGGIFIFDINTPYKYEVLMADNTIAENRDEGSFIWDNYYDADEKINEYDLTLFIKEQSEDEDDIYKKFEETHFQRCYEISELKELLEQSGLVFDAVYDAYTDDQVKCDSEKVTVIAHKG